MEGAKMRGLGEANVDESYKYFIDKLYTGQLANIPQSNKITEITVNG